MGPILIAQRDSLPPQKEVDSLKVVVVNSPTVVLLDSLIVRPMDSLVAKPVVEESRSIKRLPDKKVVRDSISIRDYKIISYARDTTYLDTTLTISKEYRYNYLRTDDFELMPFANMGQQYNELGRDFSRTGYFPHIGALAKHRGYFEKEDIDYYKVPTPMTELMFKTTMEQGQFLDALLTFNLSERFNASLAYTGFRSLGKYRYEQAKDEKFRVTFNYATRNGRYALRGHIAAQELLDEESGGLLERSQFEEGLDDFSDRAKVDLRYTDARHRILGKRYFMDHRYLLVGRERDSTHTDPTTLALTHEFSYETRFNEFTQTRANIAFGPAFLVPVEDRARLKTLYNRAGVEFSNRTLGKLAGRVGLYTYDHYFGSILIGPDGTVQNQLQGEEITLGGSYSNRIGNFLLEGDLDYTVSGALSGNKLDAVASYRINADNLFKAGIHLSSRMPNFNYLHQQSDYLNFNWQNDGRFGNIRTKNIGFAYDSKKLGLLEVQFSTVDNYSYFASTASQEEIDNGQETAFVRPFQETGSVTHLRAKYSKEFKWRKWALANALLYQKVGQDNPVLNLPQFLTRNSLYFSSDLFKKAMFLQTGITFKYFTSYHMDAYHPLLGELYTQNKEEFGGYPLLDVFINAKVRQTRIYLKAEHLNSLFSEPKYYAAPNYPYRDFVIRFGLVWNFFS